MKANMMFTLAAGLSLATSMLSATTTQPATYKASHLLDVSTSVSLQSPRSSHVRARPGDKRGKKDDGKGHKFAESRSHVRASQATSAEERTTARATSSPSTDCT